jgi:xanthine dehydrogenase iron-sulfur cluster and FAD-binding subunit A
LFIKWINDMMWKNYFCVTSLDEAIQLLAQYGSAARIVAGATDLILELERGVRTDVDTLIDITRIPGLDEIRLDERGVFHLGPLVTHNQCVSDELIVRRAFPLAQAAWEVGAPQIRNRGTIAGNLITASPANDTITPLMALGATVCLKSKQAERLIPLQDFYLGVRRTVMQPDEMLVDISFPAMSQMAHGAFIKIGLRRAQAIAVVNTAIVVELDDNKNVIQARITLGAVAPTIIHAVEAEIYLEGKILQPAVVEKAAQLAMRESKPISDLRASADYRKEMVRVAVSRGLHAIQQNQERNNFPKKPVLLAASPRNAVAFASDSGNYRVSLAETPPPILTRINGKEYRFISGHHKTLLRLLREDAGLIGTKEGCAEGECGACTVFLDGKAVMSCLVPAPRAHGADIVTIEGVSQKGKLHPVQQAFIEQGAVQCGYCTPGFIMSAVMLLDECPSPKITQVQQAITGNLCRCTGYYKIIAAIEQAALLGNH